MSLIRRQGFIIALELINMEVRAAHQLFGHQFSADHILTPRRERTACLETEYTPRVCGVSTSATTTGGPRRGHGRD